jgi:hypothetical protein
MRTIIRRIAFAAALFAAPAAWAQTILTRAQLSNDVNTFIKTNGVGAITGPILNSVLQNIINSEITQADTSNILNGSGIVVANGASNPTTFTLPGNGILNALGVNIGSPGAPVLYNGAGGTPSALDLGNATDLPLASVVGAGTAAAVNTGTTGGTIPLNNGGFTQSGTVNFTGTFEIGSIIQSASVSSISALRSETWTTLTAPTDLILLTNWRVNDGGGIFVYDSSDTTTADNGGTIIVTTNGLRYKRQYAGPVNVTWFGAVGDGSTDNQTALSNAITVAGANGSIYVPRTIYGGSYNFSGSLSAQYNGFTIIGDGPGEIAGSSVTGSELVCTSASSSDCLNMHFANGSGLQNIAVRYTNNSFSGTVVNFYSGSSISGNFLRHVVLRSTYFGQTNAYALLSLYDNADVYLDHVSFYGAQYLVDGGGAGGAGLSCYSCQFWNWQYGAVRRPGGSWDFVNPIFEMSSTAGAPAFINANTDPGPHNLTLDTPWFGDTVSTVTNFIQLYNVTGLDIRNPIAWGANATGAIFLDLLGTNDGITIHSGGNIYQFPTAINIAGTAGSLTIDGNIFTSDTTVVAGLGNVTKYVAQNNTGLADSVTATAAPVAGITGLGTGVGTALGNSLDGTGGLASHSALLSALPSLTTSQLYGGTGGAGLAQAMPSMFSAPSQQSIALGSTSGALFASVGGVLDNTAVGYNTLALGALTSAAVNNTAVGAYALEYTTTGNSNSALGIQALAFNTTGYANSAFGVEALTLNTTGLGNSAFGVQSLTDNTTGYGNNAFGEYALFTETVGTGNNAFGANALQTISNSNDITAIGEAALYPLASSAATLGTITGGSGYTNGTYNNVTALVAAGGPPNQGANYPYAFVSPYVAPVLNVTVSGGHVTAVTLVSGGSGVDLSTVLTVQAASVGGTGSGFSVPVASTITPANDVAVGANAGDPCTGSCTVIMTASDLTTVGANSALNLTSGNQDSIFGSSAGVALTTGNKNVLIGYKTGYSTLSTGSDNILICTGATPCDTLLSSTSDTFGIWDGATAWMTGTGGNSSNPAITFPGNITVNQGIVALYNNQAGPLAAGDGFLQMVSGDATHTGYFSWYNPSAVRTAYLGFDSGSTLTFNLNSINLQVSGGSLIEQATTASTSTTTGGLVDSGGLGVAGAAWIGGLENVAGVLTAANNTASTSTTTGGLVDSGGLGVAGAAYVGGKISAGSHILAASTSPAISACGVGSPAVAGSDNFGKITTGGGTLTSCVINFGVAWTTAPACSVSFSASTLAVTVATSTTQLTVGATSLTSESIFYTCGSVSQVEPANDNFTELRRAA